MNKAVTQTHFFRRNWMLVVVMLIGSSILDESRLVLAACQQDGVDEMKLIDRLDELIQQLESVEIVLRDKAEQEIIQMGLFVLDYLDPDLDGSTDAKQRIARIRIALEKEYLSSFAQPTRVNLVQTLSLADALEKISQQTANTIVITPRVPQQIQEQTLDFDLQDADFWTAIHYIMDRSPLMIDPYAGQSGQMNIGIDSQLMERIDEAGHFHPEVTQAIPRGQAGIFEFSCSRIMTIKNFRNPESNSTQLNLIVRWEPRLQPLAFDLPYADLKLFDDQGQELEIVDRERVFHGVIQPEMSALDVTLQLGPLDRNISSISSFQAELSTLLPGRQEMFRFRNIGTLDQGHEIQKGGAIVTFDGIRKNQDLYGVTISLKYDEAFNALESYRAWTYDNPVYLETKGGEQITPITLEGLRQSPESVTVRYYFMEDPADCDLVYKTLGAIVQQKFKLKIENISL